MKEGILIRNVINKLGFPDSFNTVLDAQEAKGVKKYGQRLTTDSPIDADEYAKEEAADLVMYLTLEMERETSALKKHEYENALLELREIWRVLWGE